MLEALHVIPTILTGCPCSSLLLYSEYLLLCKQQYSRRGSLLSPSHWEVSLPKAKSKTPTAQSTAILPLKGPSRRLSLAFYSVQLGWKEQLSQELLHPLTPSQVVTLALRTGCRRHRLCMGHRHPGELYTNSFGQEQFCRCYRQPLSQGQGAGMTTGSCMLQRCCFLGTRCSES